MRITISTRNIVRNDLPKNSRFHASDMTFKCEVNHGGVLMQVGVVISNK